MTYVALLRGINVGGKNKVEMTKLKIIFSSLGLGSVKTYINSGNIIFTDETRSINKLEEILEKSIEKNFGFKVKVLVRDLENIRTIDRNLPKAWVNDKSMKCDVMLLWHNFDRPDIIKELTIKPGIDQVKYVSGAIIWRVDRHKVTKSGMLKIVGTELYRHMTIRNCNTLRKLKRLMEE